MRVILLFALLGASMGLSPNWQYTYMYEGDLAVGVPEIRSQVAGTGFKATLVLQVVSRDKALAKLEDILVGEYHEDVPCEGRARMPISWSPISGEGKLLQEPFEVTFKADKNGVMIVPKEEPEWITNIRKSVVETLLLDPIRSNLGRPEGTQTLHEIFQSGKLPSSYSIIEPSMFGHCESIYTITPLKEPFAQLQHQRLRQQIKVDEENRAENELWKMIRTINFNNCKDRVLLQHAGVSNTTKAGWSQFGAVQSHSVVGDYVLSGKGGTLRVEKGVIEGAYMINPFGFNTEKLQAISNQTVFLHKVEKLGKPFVIPSSNKVINTWAQEVYSPYHPSSSQKIDWVNFVPLPEPMPPMITESVTTGIKLTKEMQEEFKNKFLTYLSKIVGQLSKVPDMPSEHPRPWNMDEGKSAFLIDMSTRLMRTLPEDIVREIYKEKFASESSKTAVMEQMLLVDISIASGMGIPIKVFLEYLQKGMISDQRAATSFMTLTNNLVSPPIIPHILTFVKKLNMDKMPYLTSTAWVNFASASHRLCLDEHSWKYAVPYQVYGKEGCDANAIISDFLNFLKRKLETVSKSWERTIVIQAISNLGTEQSISTLRDAAYGKFDMNPRVRTTAIYGLVKRKMPENARLEIQNILLPLLENISEDLEIRQVALVTLLTWHPEAALWHRFARLTWREPTLQMSSFLSFVIKSYAHTSVPRLSHMAKVAQFVLPLTKPFAPSFAYSYDNLWAKFIPYEEMKTDADLTWLKNCKDLFPREVFYFLYNNFGGFYLPLVEIAVGGQGIQAQLFKMLERIQESMPEGTRGSYMKDTFSRNSKTILDSINDQLRPETFTETEFDGEFYLRLMDNIQYFIPINSDVITRVAGEGATTFVQKLLKGSEMHLTKYINPAPVEVFLPTTIGLPLITTVSTPTITTAEGRITLVVPDLKNPKLWDVLKASEWRLNYITNYKLITKISTSLRALVPWCSKEVSTGVDSLKNVNLPMSFNFVFKNDEDMKNMTLRMKPTVTQKFPVMHMHNLPYTMVKEMWPTADYEKIDFKLITLLKERTPSLKKHLILNKGYTGMSAYLDYFADVPYPFTKAYVFDYLRKPERFVKLLASPTSRLWVMTAVYDFENSQTKEITPSFAFTLPHNVPFASQTSKTRPNYFALSTPTMKTMLKDGKLSAVYGTLKLNGTETRLFDAGLQLMKSPEGAPEKAFAAFAYGRRSPIPSFDEKPFSVCYNGIVKTPKMDSFKAFKQVLSSSPESTIEASVVAGETCHQKEIIKIQGNLRLSEERKTNLVREANSICNYDPIHPTMAFKTTPVYDKGELRVKYDMNMPRKVMNTTYMLYDVLRGITYPHIYFNYMNVRNQQGIIEVKGERPLYSPHWLVRANLPTENINMDNLWVPVRFYQLLPVGGFTTSKASYPSIVLESMLSNKCVIEPTEVRTFDGVRFPLSPRPCWSVALMDRTEPDTFVVRVRNPIPEAEIVSSKYGMQIAIKDMQIMVNGRSTPVTGQEAPIITSSGKLFAVMKKEGSTLVVRLPKKVTLYVTPEKIEIIPSESKRRTLGGICGHFNGEPTNDLVGPQGCIYTQKDLFVLSWTLAEGAQCDETRLKQEKQRVMQYQQKCPKKALTTHTTQLSREANSCMEFVYPIHTRGEGEAQVACIAVHPMPWCLPRCKAITNFHRYEMFNCWLTNGAPKVVTDNIRRGYAKHKPTRLPYVTTGFVEEHDLACHHK